MSISAAIALANDSSDDDGGYIRLINHSNHLPSGYTPDDLVRLSSGGVPVSSTAVMLRATAAEAYFEMMRAMQADGVRVPIAVSGYRSYARQTELFNNRVQRHRNEGLNAADAAALAATVVARPGTSEHQSGLAIDISMDGSLTAAFANTQQGRWLYENAWRFGFILRYPYGTTHITGIIYEPWHFRYVGLPHSRIIFENGWVLEEYIEFIMYGTFFSDVSASDWFLDDITKITGLGIMYGVSSDRFAPNAAISVDEFIGILNNLPGDGSASGIRTYLTNSGYLTREGVAMLLFEYAQLNFIELQRWRIFQHFAPFTDQADISPYAAHAVFAMRSAGIMQGRPDGRFDPVHNVTRAEVATVLSTFIRIMKSSD